MSAVTLHELNQRYIRLSDRCRSQWTFYQYLEGLFKHLRGSKCPVAIDFPGLFQRLKELGAILAHPETTRTEKAIEHFTDELDGHAATLVRCDGQVPPSLLRRFFDGLKHQDEKVLLAIIKFYLDGPALNEDALDKLDVLFTRLAEIPRDGGASIVRERHEIQRLVQPLLQFRRPAIADGNEIEILMRALADLRGEVLKTRSFSELMSCGALDRFRGLKRRLGENLLHPELLAAIVETTITIKNRFREHWQDEESSILSDTNRVMEIKRELASHPEMVSPELAEMLEQFAAARMRFDQGRQEENLRRDDALELRRALNKILEHFDTSHAASGPIPTETEPLFKLDDVGADEEVAEAAAPGPTSDLGARLPPDPLLHEYISKVVFALELVGRDRTAAEAASAKEIVALRLEPWEVEGFRQLVDTDPAHGTLTAERDLLFVRGAALRVRMDEEAREIDRLHKMRSPRLAEMLERGTQSLQRAGEMDRRFQWFIEDALYRGETEYLERLHRSRFRLLRAYSGLWLIHNERGGISPF